MSEGGGKKASLKSRLVTTFRLKPKSASTGTGTQMLQKRGQPEDRRPSATGPCVVQQQRSSDERIQTVRMIEVPVPVKAKSGPINFYNKNATGNAAQTGEVWDEAEMLHSLVRRDSNDSINSINKRARERRQSPNPSQKLGESMVAILPAELWEAIASHLTPIDAANLAVSTKTLRSLLGSDPLEALGRPENHQYKIDFLLPMDRQLPNHLLCFPCARYHLRLKKGEERLRANRILNLIYECPNPKLQSRHRLTPGHSLPFAFVQLAFRHENSGPGFGIPLSSLNRRYTDQEGAWTHQTSYQFHKGHLLLRVTSKAFAQAGLPISGLRHFLYSREDYTPYFSACAHWRDGELMKLCKCAMSHIPLPMVSIGTQLRSGPSIEFARLHPKVFVTLCERCRPMRRCPECPTEYLIELKLEEDRTEVDVRRRFKQCLVVTRWSDLGDGLDPGKGEWGAVNGVEGVEFDSFEMVGRRAIAGMFESRSGVAIPGQRVLSLNPKGERLGEKGHTWY